MNWYPEAEQLLLQGNYQQLATFYEEAIDLDSDKVDNYWYLGLTYLLQKKEQDAQTTWFFPMGLGGEEEIEIWTANLVKILETEAIRQESLEDYTLAWLIRGHIREINPHLITNLLYLINLSFKLNTFSPSQLQDWQLIDLLKDNPTEKIDQDLLLQVLTKILEFPALESVNFAEACLLYTSGSEAIMNVIRNTANNMAFQKGFPVFGADLMKLCLNLQPDNLIILKELFWVYTRAYEFDQALEIATKFEQKCDSLLLKIYGNYQIIYIQMTQSNWLAIESLAKHHQILIEELIKNEPQVYEEVIGASFIIMGQPLLYIQDNPAKNRFMINEIARLFQKNAEKRLQHLLQPLSIKVWEQPERLKIGYIGHTFRNHSVGFLARWLIHHHDREKFKIHIYLLSQQEDYLTKEWFLPPKVDVTYNFQRDSNQLIKKIQEDKIDILVDLDSMTFNLTAQVMAVKPAPIQATWLGLDASGIPAIDYFIADPYVLPENAQEYYQEKIWRLPQTYLAVDGFEVGIPTLRREDLDIPEDAVIYLNVQNALKRNPHTIHLQMQILQAVSNSYLLIKGSGNPDLTKKLFSHLAEEEGIDTARLRFLQLDSSEAIHRANLQIADIVLDTYPYNGATTTLEVLWMGIPLVTRVGEQFAARNSYTFMMNAGISEGIAWSDQEYIDWGIRLGQDKSLREKITCKLKQSRRTSPLWNGKQFTKEMENAYRQMWEIYLNK